MSNAATAKVGTIVQPNTEARARWGALLKKVEGEHWRKLRVTIRFREKLHAGKPAQLDAAQAMLKARGLEAAIEAVDVEDPEKLEAAAGKVVNEGLCEFHRREGKPGLWFPTNNIKAMMKENWGVLGYRMDARPASAKGRGKKGEEPGAADAEGSGKAIKGSRGALAEGCFIVSCDPEDRDYIHVGDTPDGIDTSVSHTMGPSGPQSSIKRNEYILGLEFSFEMWISRAVQAKFPDESIADTLYHAGEHGLGANRSQGRGRFDVVSVEDI